jgi:hypothetical protein
MNFRPELAQAVMAGRKTVTRRALSDNPRSPWWRERCSLVVGRDYAVCPGRGKHAIGRISIVSVRRVRLGDLDEAEAQREGFAGGREFVAAFEAINRCYADPDALVWRVEFEVAEILECAACGHPGDDCICWYIAETEAQEREAVA